jgi:tRNA-splicing ligase RtcB
MAFQYIQNIPVFGTPLQNAIDQILVCNETAAHSALMADHHLGYSMPIGGICAYENKISPTGVGYDISCGNKAVRLDIDAEQVQRDIKPIMDEIWSTLSFGIGMKNKVQVEHELFDDDPAWEIPIACSMKGLAREQLGTIGSGNHYVDLFIDEQDRVWVGAHFGSRGFGHRIATHFIHKRHKKVKRDTPILFDADSETGQEYIACMKLAGRYAYAGRDWVCDRVAKILSADIVEEVHNHHNFAWEEEHFGENYWVVRKGATPAFPGQKGFVGGSMGDISEIGRAHV